ncbi:muscarinic acetylcholine receptor M5-like [Ptychodera flava]|uniref:muscarinic acetylcholine receptor M5-like n=1 Tax=Ptychodera flava TaxID=63121 RepID=UPI00396A61A6
MYTIIIISVDRYKSLNNPLKHRASITSKRVKVIITAIWMASFVLYALPIVLWPNFRGSYDIAVEYCKVDFAYHSWFVWTQAALGFWLPFSILVVLYARIYCLASEVITRKKHEIGSYDLNTAAQNIQAPSVKASSAVISQKGKGVPGGQKSLATPSDDYIGSTSNYSQSPHFVGEAYRETNDNGSQTASGDIIELESISVAKVCINSGDGDSCDHRRFHYDNQTFTGVDDENASFHRLSESSIQTRRSHLGARRRTDEAGSPNEAHEANGCENTQNKAESELTVVNDNSDSMELADATYDSTPMSREVALRKADGNDIEGLIETTKNSATRTGRDSETVDPKDENDKIIACDTIHSEPVQAGSTAASETKAQFSRPVKHRKQIENATHKKGGWGNKVKRTQSAGDNKAFKTVTTLVLAITACMVPYQVMTLVFSLCPTCEHEVLYRIIYFIYYINSALDPICYAYAIHEFRRSLRRILCQCKL